MLQLEGSVRNHRIFSKCSLVYLLYFLYIILFPFTLYFVSFLLNYFVNILVSLYYVTHSLNKEKHSFLLSFHRYYRNPCQNPRRDHYSSHTMVKKGDKFGLMLGNDEKLVKSISQWLIF